MTSLTALTTLRLGRTSGSVVTATTESEIVAVVTRADAKRRQLLILGSGSNVVLADNLNSDVLVIANRGIENDASACAGAWVTVAAGEPLDELAARAAENGWVGVEALAGIPGTVGAAPLQNVGAYGQSVGDTIAQVRVLDRTTGQVVTHFAADCAFGYRTSRYKLEAERWVIISVTFQLKLGALSAPIGYPELAAALGVELGARVPLSTVRAAVLKLRASKGMVLEAADHDTWSVGSFFLNPVVADGLLPAGAPDFPQPDGTHKTSAAWLITNAGFARGFGLNERCTLSTKHSLAITNRGDADSRDVVELARHIQQGVQAKFGILLQPEPRLVGCAL